MPKLSDATRPPDMKNFVEVLQPAGMVVPPTANPGSMPNYEALSLAPAPPVLSLDIDRQRQFYRGGVSQYRISPIPSKANPSLNASSRSIATQVVTQAVAAIPSTDIEEIFTEQVTTAQYVVQVSDRAKLKTFNNAAGGTIVLPGPSVTSGHLEQINPTTGNSTAPTASVVPYFAGTAVIFVSTLAFNVSQAHSATPNGLGWSILDNNSNGNVTSLYTKLLPDASVFTAAATINSAPWCVALAVLDNVNVLPTVLQQAGTSGAFIAGVYNVTLPNPVKRGSTLIALVSSGDANPPGNPPSVAISDGVNTYVTPGKQFAPGISGQSTAEQTVAIASNAAAGFTTVTFTVPVTVPPSNLSSCVLRVYEIAANGTQSPTGFTNGWFCYLENTGIGTFTVQSSANVDGLSQTVTLGPNSGIIIAFDGVNWWTERGAGSGAGTAFYQTVQQAGVAKPQESKLNFLAPITATDNPGNTSTDIAVPNFVGDSGAGGVKGLVPAPAAGDAAANKFLKADGTFATTPAAPVTSVFGRTGAVVAVSGDYTAAQVTNAESTTNKDAANGYAGLDANTKLKLPEQATAVDARTTASEAIADSDRSKVVTFSNTSATAATIAQAGAGGSFLAGWYVDIININTGTVTLTPTTSTISGAATLVLQKGQGGRIISDGTNYLWIAGQPTTDTPADADILTYISADKRWEAKSIGAIGGANASQFRGRNISAATPLDQQVFRYDATSNSFVLAFADGLQHGSTDFGSDAAYVSYRDDFVKGVAPTTSTGGSSNIGELSWDCINAGTARKIAPVGGPYATGAIGWRTGTNTAVYSAIYWPNASAQSNNNEPAAMALMDYPGWELTWVFGFPFEDGPANAQSSFLKKQMYMGLCPAHVSTTWSPAGTVNLRPPYFLGLRYDTDPGSGALTLTAANNAAGGTTLYTGTITNGLNPGFVGTAFVVTGFANAANNGTFVCTASNNTQLTLLNAAGVAETHAGTATGSALSDSTFWFEATNNINVGQSRIDTQTDSSNTSITPTQGVAYRFTMRCTALGTIVMTLSGGGATATHTFTGIPKTTTAGQTGGLNLTLSRQNGLGQYATSADATSRTSNLSMGVGTKVTISGAANSFYNSTFTTTGCNINAIFGFTFPLAGATNSEANSAAVLTYYPGLVPFFGVGNDTVAGALNLLAVADEFGLDWNPGLMTTPTVQDPTQARYYA